jgi:hypothetical protein
MGRVIASYGKIEVPARGKNAILRHPLDIEVMDYA